MIVRCTVCYIFLKKNKTKVLYFVHNQSEVILVGRIVLPYSLDWTYAGTVKPV